jgi:phosphate transport system permease protein
MSTAELTRPAVAPPPSLEASGVNAGDRAFRGLTLVAAAGSIVVLALLILYLLFDAAPAAGRYGVAFLTTSVWDPVFEQFGAWPSIYGTVVTSLVALLLATPVAIGGALYLAEYAPAWLRAPVSFVIELLAAIPSVIFGLWAFFLLAPIMRGSVEPALKNLFGSWPIVGGLVAGPPLGKDLLTGGVILSIMVLPTVLSIAREVILTVPPTQREGMLALGATRWETVWNAVLPYARAGILGGALLGLARAIGETMAVTMVIGNSSRAVTGSLLTPGYTMASAIANQFTEADKEIYFSAVVLVGLVLLLVSTAINLLARLLIWSISRGPGDVRA